jgi:hypothetical protein
LEITSPNLYNKLCVINVYNEVVTNTIHDLREVIGRFSPRNELLVLGDFNLYHPLWSTKHRHCNNGISAAQPLLAIIEEFQLKLLTVPGTSTHRWKDGESTIDLTFASEDIAARTIHCKLDRDLDCDSDYLPIATAVGWDWKPAPILRKPQWTKTNIQLLQQTVKDQIHRIPSAALKDRDSIDEYVGSIITALQAGIDASTPWSNPSPRSIPGFDQECKDLCREVQQLRRRWQRTILDSDHEAYREACNRKGRCIRKTLRNNHRQRVRKHQLQIPDSGS